MSVVTYKCNTCKRDIKLPRNIKGLETVGQCIITHGCRGSLYQTGLHPDYVRGSLPTVVDGLDDWIQRKVLHNHIQTIENNEWTIEHDMGVIPTVNVFVNWPTEQNPDNQVEIIPNDIVAIDDNTIKLILDRAWSGKAQLVARQSDPDLLKPKIRQVATPTEPFQLSNNGEITIATRINAGETQSSTISLLLTYDSTASGDLQELYQADDQPSLNSAWSDYDRAVITVNSQREVYTIRSFNGIVPNMTTGTIGSGSTFKFEGIDITGMGTSFQDIASGEVLILLSTRPYGRVDKIFTQIVDVTKVSATQNPFGFYYNNGEFFAEDTIIQNIFPQILNVDY